MFLNDLIQRRLVSLLRPWLSDEPDLEFKLGFLRSNGIVRNLNFSTSVFNQLLDESSRFRFKEVTVEELSVRFSYWSFPAYSVHVRGLVVTLSLCGDNDEGGGSVRRRKKLIDTSLELKKQSLAEIDPEGSALHDTIKRIANVTLESWKTNLTAIILKYGRLQVENIRVLLLPPMHNDSNFCALEFKEIGAESDYVYQPCFIVGFLGSLFLPSRKSSFHIDIRHSEFVLRSQNFTSVIMRADISSYILMENLEFNKFFVFAPSLRFTFSPSDLVVVSAFYLLLSMESKKVRTGRQLWTIAANKISSLISSPKLSLARFVGYVQAWLHYRRSYAEVLFLIGYPLNHVVKRSAVRMLLDKKYSKSVKDKWDVLSELEKELPTQAIVHAWRAVRYRASGGAQEESNTILPIPKFLFLKQFFGQFVGHSKVDCHYKAVWDDFFLTRCSSLCVGELSVSVYPEYGVQPVDDLPNSIVSQDFASIHFLCDAVYLSYVDRLVEDHLMFSAGHLKLVSSSAIQGRSHDDDNLSGEFHSRNILWSEPAKVFTSEGQEDDGRVSIPLLQIILGKMRSNWKHVYSSFHANDCRISEAPCVLFESRSFMTCQNSKSHTSGICKGGLVVGRLKCLLEYVSVCSLAVAFRQVQDSLFWAAGKTESNDVVHTSTTHDVTPVSGLDSLLGNLPGEVLAIMTRLVPKKIMEVGIVIAGPKVQLASMSKENESWLSLDIGDIELAVSPDSRTDFKSFSDDPAFCNEHILELECESSDIWKFNDEVDSCQGTISLTACVKVNGLSACIGKSSDDLRNQFIMLSPSTLRVISSRKEIYSLDSVSLALSVALHWITFGFTALIFLDELLVLVEVMSNLWFSVSHTITFYGSSGDQRYPEFAKQMMAYAYAEFEQMPPKELKVAFCVFENTHFRLKTDCDLHMMNILVHRSRRGSDKETCGDDAVPDKHLPLNTLIAYGFHTSFHKTCVKFCFASGISELSAVFSGIQSVVSKYSSEILQIFEHVNPRQLMSSLHCLCEMSVTSCNLSLCMNASGKSVPSEHCLTGDNSAYSNGIVRKKGNSPLVVETGSSVDHCQHWLCMKIFLSEVFLIESSVKNVLNKKERCTSLVANFSYGNQFQEVRFQLQGGSIYLDTMALFMFLQLFSIMRYRAGTVSWPAAQLPNKSIVARDGDSLPDLDRDHAQDFQQHQGAIWNQLETFNISLSKLTIVIVARDENGRLQEFLLEADFRSSLEVQNVARKLSLGIPKISVLSQFLYETMEHQARQTQSFQLPSATPGTSNTTFNRGDSSVYTGHGNLVHPIPIENDFYADNSENPIGYDIESSILSSSVQNYILKELSAAIMVECPIAGDTNESSYLNQVWAGTGSVSGGDVILSLTEIQIILLALESFPGISGQETTDDTTYGHWSVDQESEGSFEDKLPDGTIVALEDIYEHMFIAAEEVDSVYRLNGTIHYSLVGSRALFRVKHQNPSRWWPQEKCISLISMYAKDEFGQPLSLNCRPKSDFVDISGACENASTLWSMLPYRPESYDGDFALKSYEILSKNTFYLVNKKNDRAVAFIDGVLEFVSKPGNPVKFKVFHDTISSHDNLSLPTYFMRAPGSSLQHHSGATDQGLLKNVKLTLVVNKVTLTIMDQLLDSAEKIPLLQGSINSAEIIVQVLSTKARFMVRFELMLDYFDAQKNLWEEMVHLHDFIIFYRYRFSILDSENVFPGVPRHMFAKIKELRISLSELSLDILLFVIGKLKLAGPFAVRSSAILANCCKIENKSEAPLLCKFYNNQCASVAAGQSTTIFLKKLAVANQSPEASVFSIQLTNEGALCTSPIHLSLLEARVFAWRTRLVSSKESKSYPGPFIVVEVSKRSTDGLSIIVSPVLRVHNKTDFSMELRFQRPQQKETESASIMLKAGDSVDDSIAAFGATNLSGGLKKALISLSVGNFLLTFRPNMTDELLKGNPVSVEWSDELKGGKPVRLSGVFDKLSYRVRAAFSDEAARCTFSTVHCVLNFEDGRVSHVYFLVQSLLKDVPVIQPDDFDSAAINRNSPVALQEQKEIFLLPTVRVVNLLHSEIHIMLSDEDPRAKVDYDNFCSQATLSCGASVNLYANPAIIYFSVTLTEFSSSCKPVNSSDWVKKLQKQKSKTRHLDIELDFDGGKYFAILRLARSNRGVLEAILFTSYALQNDSDVALCFFSNNHKFVSRKEEVGENLQQVIPPHIGLYLPPKSTRSWFLNSHKVRARLVEEKVSEALLDLDALSGLTEMELAMEEESGKKILTKLGVSLKPSLRETIPSHLVSMSSRHVVLNHSEDVIQVRQCYLQDDMEGIITVKSNQRVALKLQNTGTKLEKRTIMEKLLRKHAKSQDDPLFFIQFQTSPAFGWSGPVCLTSLGQFFLKFRRSESSERQPYPASSNDAQKCEFAMVHVVEDGSALVLHFYRPYNINLPYRIENFLPHAPITFYQKGSLQPDVLGSGHNTSYVWDDLTLPHKLVVQVDDLHVLREINLDKVRAWKPFCKTKAQVGFGFLLPDKRTEEKGRSHYGQLSGDQLAKLGYEVYAEGLTRVLRVREFSNGHKGDTISRTTTKMRFRISYSTVQLLEFAKQEKDLAESSIYTPVIVIKLENLDMRSMLTDFHEVNQISLQSLTMDQKWVGAPFTSVLCKHRSEFSEMNDKVLQVVLVLYSSGSTIKQVKYLSIILQPLNLNLDEETLMRLVPFWRRSLSDPSVPSQRYYFDQFEIHPIKIVASYLSRDSYANYTSTQEMLRSLLHSVIKIPTIKNMNVELNGVLVQHALLTLRDLSIKCAQHYSWYALRAVYIAKGSPLLPPAFGSIFDDFASSSLDVFFDTSRGVINLPGLTMGTFKLLRKCTAGKGFSGTKRYFGDLGKTLKLAGSNVLFAAITEISDSVLRGSETSGFDGMIRGFHQGILQIAMEPSLLGSAFLEGGPTRKITLDRTPGVDELYIEGYLQALLDTLYKQEYLRVRVIENQVILKNLPPSSSLINEIMERVRGFLVGKGLLKGDPSAASRSLRHTRGETEWRIGPTLLTLCEHLFVSFAIRQLRKQAGKVTSQVRWKKREAKVDDVETEKNVSSSTSTSTTSTSGKEPKVKIAWRWGIGKFVLSCMVAYVDGRLCRRIPNPIARRVVSGFLLSFLEDEKD